MGRYYATADGEPAEVAAAIDEHYHAARRRWRAAGHRRRRRRGAGRQARHAGRHLRHRPEAQRHQGSVRSAPRRHRRAAHPHREETRSRSARAGDARRASCSPCRTRLRPRSCGITWSNACARISSTAAVPAASPASPPRCSTRCAPAAPVSPLDFGARLDALVSASSRCPKRQPHRRQQAHRQHPQEGGSAERRGTVDVARCCASPPRRRCTKRWPASSPTSMRALDKRDYARRAHAARDAASRGRWLLRRRHGQRRGSRPCGAIAWRCSRSCATSSRASRICPACRAERAANYMQLLGVRSSSPCSCALWMLRVRPGLLHRLPVPAVARPLLDGRRA